MLGTSGFLSPHLHHSRLKYLTDLSEFSGSGFVIKDLNKLRNRDVLRLNQDERLSPSALSPLNVEEESRTSCSGVMYTRCHQNKSTLSNGNSTTNSQRNSTSIRQPGCKTSLSGIGSPSTTTNKVLEKRANFFMKVKKGKVWEDQTAGVKQSNGIKIIWILNYL